MNVWFILKDFPLLYTSPLIREDNNRANLLSKLASFNLEKLLSRHVDRNFREPSIREEKLVTALIANGKD